MIVDPLMMTRSDCERSSQPPTFLSPFSARPPSYNHYPRGYNPVPTLNSNFLQSVSESRNNIIFTPPLSNNPSSGDFDDPPRPSDDYPRFFHSGRSSQHNMNGYSSASGESSTSYRTIQSGLGTVTPAPNAPGNWE